MMLRHIGVAFISVALLLPIILGLHKGDHAPSSFSSRSPSALQSTRSTSSIPKKSTTGSAGRANREIKRSATAPPEFMQQTGFPKGRKGYTVDHVVPLKCGGLDAPSNM
jgi:hypothetical protein